MMQKRIVALALLAALAGCQRQAPLAVAPHTVPPRNLRLSEKPLDPNRIRGAGPFGDSVMLAVEAGVAGDRVSALLEVPKSDCAVVIARGSETVEDLDLLAYGEDGAPLGSDEASDRQPSLLICPPHSGRVVLAARIAQGHGLVALGAQRVAPALADKVAERYQVKSRAGTDAARVKAWPGLEPLIARERERVGGKFQDLRRVALALDATTPTTLAATIDAGRCVHGLFIPSEDVSHLDVAALDDQGRILGRAFGSGRNRALVVCSPSTTEVTFEVRPHAGRGLAVAALSRSVAGTESEIDGELRRSDVYPSGDAKRELASALDRLKKWGYAPSPPLAKLELQVGRRTSSSLTFGSGCTRVELVGAAPLRGLDARLWSESGALRATATGGGSATLFACGAGNVRLDVSAVLAPGTVTVLAQREAAAPPELTRLPLAGGRLVARMVSRGVLLRADAIGKVSELALSAERLTTVPVMVPLDRCVDVNVAVEGPAAGVELRAVDQDTELELDSAVGESAASTRLCSYGRGGRGSLNARIELRAVSSTASALVATRLLSPAD
jgi:predicted small lipoprotein YifL